RRAQPRHDRVDPLHRTGGVRCQCVPHRLSQPPVSLGRGRSLLSYRGARAVRARLPAHAIPHRTLGAGRAATFLGGSMQTRNVTYRADGADMIGFFAIDETRGGSRPGVLVAPEAPGLDDLTRERCKRLATLGYAAL